VIASVPAANCRDLLLVHDLIDMSMPSYMHVTWRNLSFFSVLPACNVS
jgi:hypothetical protein